MMCYGFVQCFTVSRPVSLRESKSRFAHNVTRCSVQMRETSGKKRARQTYQVPPEDGKVISDVYVGDEFIGTIAEVGPANSSWVDIGVFTKRGRPVHARLPFPVRKRSTLSKDVEGAVVPVYVKTVNRHAGRIEVRKGVRPPYEEVNPSSITMLDSLRVGDKLEGTVVGLGSYGAVVDAKVYRFGKGGSIVTCHGLLQRKSFRKEWYSAADKIIKSDAEVRISMGDAIDVYVRAAHVQNAFLLFDACEVQIEDVVKARQEHRTAARRRYRRAPVGSLKVGELRDGVVANVAQYGLFVDVGVKSNGLIHYSEIGERHKLDWKEIIGVDTHLTVEVLGVEDNKISLRLVSLKEEALEYALEVAESATARPEDVELASTLQVSSKYNNVKNATSNSTNEARATHVATSEFETAQSTDEEIKDIKETEDEQEAEDKFSDEYFEDKYGF